MLLVSNPCISVEKTGSSNNSEQAAELRIAYFSQDPPSIDPLSPAFDPDSYAVISQIFDSLIYMDLDGEFKAGLAIGWHQLSETKWQFNLRRNVKFHNGEVFDAKSVKFTFDYILDQKNKTGNRWIFSSLSKVHVDKKDPFKVIFELLHPDGMFLNRLNLFGSICPPLYIKKNGFEYFRSNPVGTGPFRFSYWKSNSAIRLEKNQNYWSPEIPKLKSVEFSIMDKSLWPDAFSKLQVDFIPNLSGNKTSELMRVSQGQARIIKRPVLISYWVMLKNKGVLSNLNVRKALNHAINKNDIISYADFGNAIPMASLGKKGEFGANQDLEAYHYDVEHARNLLNQAEVKGPIKLKALVADVAESAARIIQANLKVINVHLDMEVVSRSEWSNRIVGYKIINGTSADYDIIINMVDNPIYNLAFHAGLFLQSSSPWSLLESPEFDQKFAHALRVSDSKTHQARLKELDRYIHEQALMLFTTQKIITAAIRKNFDIKTFGASGHLNYQVLSQAKKVINE